MNPLWVDHDHKHAHINPMYVDIDLGHIYMKHIQVNMRNIMGRYGQYMYILTLDRQKRFLDGYIWT